MTPDKEENGKGLEKLEIKRAVRKELNIQDKSWIK